MPGLKSALQLAQKKITDSEHEYVMNPLKKWSCEHARSTIYVCSTNRNMQAIIEKTDKHICSRKSAQKNVFIHALSLHYEPLALPVSFSEVLFSIPYLLPVHHLVNSSLLKDLYGQRRYVLLYTNWINTCVLHFSIRELLFDFLHCQVFFKVLTVIITSSLNN